MSPVALVAGYGVRYPLGGCLLSQLYYLAGLQQLGYEAIWVEHYGWTNSCYDPAQQAMTDDPAYGLDVLRRELAACGVRRWCYVDAKGVYHGIQREEMQRLCRESALLLSLAATTWLEEFRECRVRAFVDTDPGFTQFKTPPVDSRSCDGYASPWDFTHHFTIGGRIGQPDCPIPTHGIQWHPTRWPLARTMIAPQYTPAAPQFTTVMSWTAYGPATYQGVTYGQKDVEFLKLLDLPKQTGPVFEVALASDSATRNKLSSAGWVVSDALAATMGVKEYLDFIGSSRGEFSVAKNGYVATRSGWFSERTLTYLARGKPAIVQDTGWSEVVPSGEGLFAFRNAEEVVAAVAAIESDYAGHCRAARRIADEYFDSAKILAALLQTCGLPVISPA